MMFVDSSGFMVWRSRAQAKSTGAWCETSPNCSSWLSISCTETNQKQNNLRSEQNPYSTSTELIVSFSWYVDASSYTGPTSPRTRSLQTQQCPGNHRKFCTVRPEKGLVTLPMFYLVDVLIVGQLVLLRPVIQSTLMEGVNFHAFHQNKSTKVATSSKRIKTSRSETLFENSGKVFFKQ